MGRRGRGDCNMGGPGGLQEVTYAVPADKCGLVIGKGKKHVFIRLLKVDLNACCCCENHYDDDVLLTLFFFFFFYCLKNNCF